MHRLGYTVVLALFALLPVSGCTCNPAGLQPPRPEQVDPAKGYNEISKPVTIEGKNFFVKVTRNLEGKEEFVIDDHFTAILDLQGQPETLEPVVLKDVKHVDTKTLTATVPPGIAVGTYTLTLTGPYGLSGTLEDAYEATAPPEVLTATLSASPAKVGLDGNITLTLEVSNQGQGAALGVTPSDPVISGIGSVQLLSGPAPESFDSSPGGRREFVWTYKALEVGEVIFESGAGGTNQYSGLPVQTGPAQTDPVRIFECESHSDCLNPKPICSLGGRCMACESDAECLQADPARRRCDISTGSCQPCLDHTDCDAPRPYCEPGTHACVACLETGHCDDGNPCTDDSCTGFDCLNENNAASCDDGLFCNGTDACSGGGCSQHSGDPCAGGPECSNVCDETNDTCLAPAGAPCNDDGFFCTGQERCDGAGACVSSGDPCPGTECNTCQEATNSCFDPLGTACTDDGLFCNGTESCNGTGSCVGAGDPCPGTECNTCQEATDSCFDPLGVACADDGLFCDGTEQCNGTGSCAGSGDPCPGTPCNTCQEATDSCFDPLGVACTDDGLFCNGSEQCNGTGSCLGAGDPCPGTECNTCQEATDICFDPSGTVCTDDGLFCDGAEQCNGTGSCVGSGDPCPGTECNTCQEATDGCFDPLGTVCTDDGLFCNGAEQCNGTGSCVGSGDPCPGTECNTCQEATDGCFDPLGTVCTDDGLFCNGAEQCNGTGSCVGAGDPCPGTECNTCQEATDGCFDSLGAVCTDDGLFCNGPEQCNGAGACVFSGDPCADQICDEAGDSCADYLVTGDPVGDLSSFSFVFSYLGRIWVGPRTDGAGAVHMQPDGSSATPASFSFFKDTSGNSHRNNSPDPYPSIGTTGCANNTPACGPDNEDGRGIFCSGTIGADEWLVVAGGRSGGDLDYVYMTRDSDDLLDFSYVDLDDSLGGNTKGISSMHVFSDRLFLGFPDTGGSRPYLVSVNRTPTAPGLDAVDNGGDPCDPLFHDACDLDAKDFPDVGGSAGMSMIDTITDFNDRLYVANNGGVVRSTTNQPLDYNSNPGHWTAVTPSAAGYSARVSVTTSKTADLEPADKAVPAMASFGGRLFLARNTDSGPQLWACTPDIESGPAPSTANDCDPGDWQPLALNTAGDTFLTQFNNPNNMDIALIEVSGAWLYVGFDNPTDGVVLFRTANPSASNASDFEGESGCPADQHPAGCAGLHGNGFGDVNNARIFSSTLMSVDGTDYLYVIVGNGADPVRLYTFRG